MSVQKQKQQVCAFKFKPGVSNHAEKRSVPHVTGVEPTQVIQMFLGEVPALLRN